MERVKERDRSVDWVQRLSSELSPLDASSPRQHCRLKCVLHSSKQMKPSVQVTLVKSARSAVCRPLEPRVRQPRPSGYTLHQRAIRLSHRSQLCPDPTPHESNTCETVR